jgi:hypothetical membrane protein
MTATGGATHVTGATSTGTQTRVIESELAGVALFALAAQFMTVIMLGTSIAPGYDIRGGAISDLGVIPETALLFNVSLVVTGALNVPAGVLLYRSFRRVRIPAVFTVAGVGAIGAGLLPLDTGGAHGLFALVAFIAFNLQALAIATVTAGPMRALSALAGLVGLAFVAVMVVGDAGSPAVFGPIGHGGAERLIVYPVMLWLMAYGGALIGAGRLSPGLDPSAAWRRTPPPAPDARG